MLRVAEQWYGSDVGRQRQGNEDNYFVQSPLFVVADGMGGANAGEVASAMAVEAFRAGLPNGDPDDALVAIIQGANHRIHDMSRSDAQHQGMGTTCTAVYVAEEEVVLAHVGDSRCYLFRDGELTKLTRDHSLVGELVDRGKLTEEQAEVHPQRSVITRALGPEADVRVDTERIEARGGDLFLLCSDGLTSMIREHTILPILQQGGSLEAQGRALIGAANDAGGRDNITVVLFRLEEIAVAGDGAVDEYQDFGAAATRVDPADAPTQAGAGAPSTADVAAAVRAADEAAAGTASDADEAAYRAEGTMALSAIQARQPAPPEPSSTPPPRTAPLPSPAAAKPRPRPKRRRRVPGPAVFVLVAIAIVAVAAFFAIRGVFFVGLDQHRAVTIFRGVPYELPLGLHLYSHQYTSGVTIDQVPAARRATFTGHKLRSLHDASDLVRQLETGRLAQ